MSEMKETAVKDAVQVEEGTIFAPELQDHPLVVAGTPRLDGWGAEKTVAGLSAMLTQAFSENADEPRIDLDLIDAMIARIDAKMSAQLDEVLHAPAFQAVESAWRGLKLLVDRTKFDGPNRNVIRFLDVTKQELADDLQSPPRTDKLYKVVFLEEYAQYGGEPIGAILANYSFGPSTPDVSMLEKIAETAEMAHAPFIAAAGPQFWGKDSYTDLPKLNDLRVLGQERWASFREARNSNYVGLTMPRFLLRHPYDPVENPVRAFRYRERVEASHEHYLWGNTAFAFGTRLTESFSNYGWCPYIIGPKFGGTVPSLPIHKFYSDGDREVKAPTEILIPDPMLMALSGEGFIPLVFNRGSDNACFFYANSTQRPKEFANTEEGQRAAFNFKLGTQLPYMFLVSRLSHHIQTFQRQELGRPGQTKELMQTRLKTWLKQYCAEFLNPDGPTQARRPFYKIDVKVADIPGDPGWFSVAMKVQPHLTYLGAHFELSLVGQIEPNK